MKVVVYEKIQEGGYGSLHRALTEDQVPLAVKKIPIEGSNGLPCLTEASIFSSFSHPALLKSYGVSIDSGHLNILLPLGESDLLSWRDTNPMIDPRMLKSWIYCIIEGIWQLHSQGLIHADIKAENVIKFRDCVKLTDFSLTRPIRPYRGLIATSTHRPPESWAGETWDEKIDIWGLGCLIYQLVYGESPFPDQENPEAALNTIRMFINFFRAPAYQLALTRTNCLPPYVPEPMRKRSLTNTFILTCLQWDPKQRPSAKQLLEHSYFVGMNRRPGSFISTPMVYLKEEEQLKQKLGEYVDDPSDLDSLRQFQENAYQLYNRSLRLDLEDEIKLKTCAWIACKLTRCPVNFKCDFAIQLAEKQICEHLNFRLHRPSLPPQLIYPRSGSSSGTRRRNLV